MADSNQAWAEFLQRFPQKTFAKGEIIIFQGEVPRYAYFITSGVIKAYNLSVNGDEKPVGFYGENEVFPASWVFDRTPSAVYYHEAFTDKVTASLVPRDDYINFLKQHSDSMFTELQSYVLDQQAKSMRLNALQHSRASDKLIYTLHYLALRHGRPAQNGQTQLKLDLTHQDFANLTGLTRETAATELGKLKRLKVIDYGKNMPYTINVGRLASLLNDEYISDLKLKQ